MSERKQFYVYIYRDPRDGKQFQPIYVGKGAAIHRRAYFHWEEYATNPLLAAVLHKIKSLGLKPIIEIYEWFDDEKEALNREHELICKYRSRQEGGTLCNLLTAKAGGGFCHSEKTKEKIMTGILDPLLCDLSSRYYPHLMTITVILVIIILLLISILILLVIQRYE